MLRGHRDTNADNAWEMEVVVLGQAAAGVKATLREAAKPGRPQGTGYTLVERT